LKRGEKGKEEGDERRKKGIRKKARTPVCYNATRSSEPFAAPGLRLT